MKDALAKAGIEGEELLAGAIGTLAPVVATALINVDADTFGHPTKWLIGLGSGCAVALGLALKGWSARRQAAAGQ